MAMLKLLAAGALGFCAYKAWQRYQKQAPASQRDTGNMTPPHGDPILARADLRTEPAPATSVQSSRGFGDP